MPRETTWSLPAPEEDQTREFVEEVELRALGGNRRETPEDPDGALEPQAEPGGFRREVHARTGAAATAYATSRGRPGRSTRVWFTTKSGVSSMAHEKREPSGDSRATESVAASANPCDRGAEAWP